MQVRPGDRGRLAKLMGIQYIQRKQCCSPSNFATVWSGASCEHCPLEVIAGGDAEFLGSHAIKQSLGDLSTEWHEVEAFDDHGRAGWSHAYTLCWDLLAPSQANTLIACRLAEPLHRMHNASSSGIIYCTAAWSCIIKTFFTLCLIIVKKLSYYVGITVWSFISHNGDWSDQQEKQTPMHKHRYKNVKEQLKRHLQCICLCITTQITAIIFKNAPHSTITVYSVYTKVLTFSRLTWL